MKNEEYITIYKASREWRISDSFFEGLKHIKEYAIWFKGDASKYGQNLVAVEALPIIKELYDETCEQFRKYNEDPEYINIGGLTKSVLVPTEEIKDMIQSGNYEGYYVQLLRRREVDPVFGPYIYFFRLDFLEHLDYLSTGLIVKLMRKKGIKIADSTLLRYKKNGDLSYRNNAYGIQTFSFSEALQVVLDKRKEKYKTSQRYSMQSSNFYHLNHEQKQIIEDYLLFRSRGGRVSHNNFKTKKHIANKEATLKKQKSALATFFFRIICERSGISQRPEMRYGSLTEEEQERYNPEVFSPLDIDAQEALAIIETSKTTTAVSVYQAIKPFYYWILQEKKAKASTPEKWFEYGQFERTVDAFLNQFPTNYNERPAEETIQEKNKAFLTREQMIRTKQILLNDPRSHDPFKFATMWQLCCVTGLRPYEVTKLRIEHFKLDGDGFLITNHRGWGELHLPTKASKHERSPSHPVFGTPVPKGTVQQINEYLRRLYSRQKNEPVGVGYMFRPDDMFTESGYKTSLMSSITRVKNQLDFLPKEQRRDFELKAARRSMNNLIDGIDVKFHNDRLNGRIQKVAGDIQMRHQIAGDDVGDKHYTAPISADDLYEVLDATISFPWNLRELEEWEIQKEGFKAGVILDSPRANEGPEKNPSANTRAQPTPQDPRLKEIKQELNKLRKRPKHLSVEEWLDAKEALEKEKRSMEL